LSSVSMQSGNQASGDLVQSKSKVDSIKDLDDFGKVMEEFMTMFEDLQSEVDEKTGGKKEQKSEKIDNLAQAEKIFVFLETLPIKIKEAIKALDAKAAFPNKPNISVPKLVSELRGDLSGPEGTGNPWLAKSMMTDLITIMMELVPILAKIKIEETKNEMKAMKEQHDVTETIGKAQIQKAKLEAEQLRLDAIKQFVSAGVTLGTMVGMMAMQAVNTVKGAASTVKGAVTSVAGAVKGAASAVGGQAMGAAKGAMGSSKGGGSATGDAGGDDMDVGGVDGGDGPSASTTNSTSTTSTSQGTPNNANVASSQNATSAANSSQAGQGAGTKNSGTSSGGVDGVEGDAGSEVAGAGEGAGDQSKGAQVGSAVKQATDSLGTTGAGGGNPLASKAASANKKQEQLLQQFQQLGKIGEGIAGGVLDTMKAALKEKQGFVEAEITMLQNVSKLVGKAAEAAREEKRSAADMISNIFNNMQKLIDAQAAFRITR